MIRTKTLQFIAAGAAGPERCESGCRCEDAFDRRAGRHDVYQTSF